MHTLSVAAGSPGGSHASAACHEPLTGSAHVLSHGGGTGSSACAIEMNGRLTKTSATKTITNTYLVRRRLPSLIPPPSAAPPDNAVGRSTLRRESLPEKGRRRLNG